LIDYTVKIKSSLKIIFKRYAAVKPSHTSERFSS